MSVEPPVLKARSPTTGEQYRRRLQRKAYDFPRVPVPIYRHAAPSAPWPWMNFDIDTSEVQPILPRLNCDTEWGQYPQSLFRNWTPGQVNRSQMLTKCSDSKLSTIYNVNVFNDGDFDKREGTLTVRKENPVDLRAYWDHLGIPPPSNIRVQAIFVEDMTLPVLQMLGTRYNIEPFFFASSVNWIPSRYREDPKLLEDHITIILPFIRTLKNRAQRPIARTRPVRTSTLASTDSQTRVVIEEPLPYMAEKQIIDTQAALSLPDNKILLQDLLSLHMVRKTTTSTIISYHPSLQGTSAKRLQSLVQRTGDSVYWSNIFKRSKDPTFLLLAILWYALYTWDEAFEFLYRYINTLEYKVIQSNDIKLTQELHKLQAHLLQYQQLLQDFLRSVEFVRDTPNPAMNAAWIPETEREDSVKLLRIEANNLISEIERLTRQREMLFERLENAIHLTFATMNIQESKAMQGLTASTKKNSTVIKQVSYLAMFFLPGSYLANVFRMNVREIHPPSHSQETLAHYIEAVAGLALFTSWFVIAIQRDSYFYPDDSDLLHRSLWPLFYAYGAVSKIRVLLESTGGRFLGDTRSSSTLNEGRRRQSSIGLMVP